MPDRGAAGESPLVRRARADGERAARADQYDEWSFEDERPVAYAQQLRHEAAKAVAEEEERLARRLGEIDEQRATERVRQGETAERADAARRLAEERLLRAQRRRDESLEQLNLLTGVHVPHPDAAPGGPNQTRRWIGPADGAVAPSVPRWLKLPLVLLVATVEVPIHFATFRTFDPRNLPLVWCFTIPVALCMVLAPHLAGIWLRKRLAEPRIGIVPTLTCGVLMTAWLGASLVLADLRATFLIAPEVVEGVTIRSRVDSLSPTTLVAVFALVLVLSGLISFLLGIADDHPEVSAYRSAVRYADRAERRYLTAVNRHAGAGIAEAADRTDPAEPVTRQHQHRVEAIRADYAAAWAAYCDAWSLAGGSPTKTLAASAAAPPNWAPA